jgi:predicted nucleotidyltransferase
VQSLAVVKLFLILKVKLAQHESDIRHIEDILTMSCVKQILIGKEFLKAAGAKYKQASVNTSRLLKKRGVATVFSVGCPLKIKG